jgi:hypothetical protein
MAEQGSHVDRTLGNGANTHHHWPHRDAGSFSIGVGALEGKEALGMRGTERWAALGLLGIVSATGCHSKPEPAPSQVVAQDLTAFRAEIRKVVKDSSRAERLIDITNEFARTVGVMVDQDKATAAMLDSLNADYHATRAQYDAVVARITAERHAGAQQLVSLRGQMAVGVTDAEWDQLRSVRVRLLGAELNAVQQQ